MKRRISIVWLAGVSFLVLGFGVSPTASAVTSRVGPTSCPTLQPKSTGVLGPEITGFAAPDITRTGFAPQSRAVLCVFPQAQQVWSGTTDANGAVRVPTGETVAPTFVRPVPTQWYYVLLGIATDGSNRALTQEDYNVYDDQSTAPIPDRSAPGKAVSARSAYPANASAAPRNGDSDIRAASPSPSPATGVPEGQSAAADPKSESLGDNVGADLGSAAPYLVAILVLGLTVLGVRAGVKRRRQLGA